MDSESNPAITHEPLSLQTSGLLGSDDNGYLILRVPSVVMIPLLADLYDLTSKTNIYLSRISSRDNSGTCNTFRAWSPSFFIFAPNCARARKHQHTATILSSQRLLHPQRAPAGLKSTSLGRPDIRARIVQAKH